MDRRKKINQALTRLGSIAVQRLRQNISKDNTRATSKLHDSMYYKVVKDRIEIFMLSYGLTVDEGRKPFQRVPRTFQRDIQKWMSFKGISPQKKTVGESAKAIARSIYKRGTIKRFGYRGSNFIDRAVDNTLAEFDSDLLTAWMTDLDKELDKLK
jgi:hypothetical protein|tara:strand:- start:600 stop:1064 length:465 start_codon:yes stop_codon:yes gene_type:complete